MKSNCNRGSDTVAQRAALKETDCDRVFQDEASGGRWDRLKLQLRLKQLRSESRNSAR